MTARLEYEGERTPTGFEVCGEGRFFGYRMLSEVREINGHRARYAGEVSDEMLVEIMAGTGDGIRAEAWLRSEAEQTFARLAAQSPEQREQHMSAANAAYLADLGNAAQE